MLANLDDAEDLGEILLYQWADKRDGSPSAIHDQVDEWIRFGMKNEAYGGKLVGAGDGGFILFATHNPGLLEQEMPLRRLPFKFTHEGSRCV